MQGVHSRGTGLIAGRAAVAYITLARTGARRGRNRVCLASANEMEGKNGGQIRKRNTEYSRSAKSVKVTHAVQGWLPAAPV